MDEATRTLCDIMIRLVSRLQEYFDEDSSDASRHLNPSQACENAIEDIINLIDDCEQEV